MTAPIFLGSTCMKKRFFSALFIGGAALILVCGPSQSPYTNPADAKIVPDNSLRSLDAMSDSLKVFTTVKCTVEVYLPKLIDSFYVHLSRIGSDSIIASGAVTGASFDFPLSVSIPGVYNLTVVVVKTDKSGDTLTKPITVYAMVPVVVPDAPSHTVFLPADSFTFRFTVTDPDSNVRFAYTWIDTVMSPPIVFLPTKPFRETFSRTVNKARLLAAVKAGAPIVCYALAIDVPDSNVSEIAACTLYVRDTIVPAIGLLVPDTAVALTVLPVTIKALITDIAGVTTATFNGAPMMISGDTASFEAVALDSGKHVDSIVAMDVAGNKGRLLFPLTYHGKQLYPPLIKELSRAVIEGRKFDTLFLDTCVIIKDSSIVNKLQYARDSLTWLITDSAGGQVPVSASHKIVIPQSPDTEWTGTIRLTFKATINNPPLRYDTKQPSFFVTEVPDKPVILVGQYWCSNTAYSDTLYLDTATTVRDPDDALRNLNWKFTQGKHFRVDSLYTTRLGLPKTAVVPPPIEIGPILSGKFNRHVRIGPITAADESFYGTDTLTFTVTDPGGLSDSKAIYFSRTTFKCLYHIPFPTLP
jgi:hypothetical protein